VTHNVGNLFCAYWSSICLPWGCAYSNLLSIRKTELFVFLLLSFEFFIYSVCNSFIKDMICKYLLPVCGLSFYSRKDVFQREDFVLLRFVSVKSNLLIFGSGF